MISLVHHHHHHHHWHRHWHRHRLHGHQHHHPQRHRRHYHYQYQYHYHYHQHRYQHHRHHHHHHYHHHDGTRAVFYSRATTRTSSATCSLRFRLWAASIWDIGFLSEGVVCNRAPRLGPCRIVLSRISDYMAEDAAQRPWTRNAGQCQPAGLKQICCLAVTRGSLILHC